jgi:tetratricopeptide (TPR) repeat protein
MSLQAAVDALSRDDLALAEQLITRLNWQQDVNALSLLARISLRRGEIAQALDQIESALRIAPAHPMLVFLRANALRFRGDLDAAILAYHEVINSQANHIDAHFNLGLCLRDKAAADRKLLIEATRRFVRAAKLKPELEQAYKLAVLCLAELANEGFATDDLAGSFELQQAQQSNYETQQIDAFADTDIPKVSVVVCSINPQKFAAVQARYQQLIPSPSLQLIGIHDAKGLSEAYNRGIDQADGEVIIFSHDDIEILNDDFAARMLRHLEVFDAIGVAGTSKLTGAAVFWSGNPFSQNWMTQRDPATTTYKVCVNQFSMLPVRVQALDGALIAVRADVARRHRFKESIGGFHFYDLSFSYELHQAGRALAVVSDLRVVHHSEGNFDAQWQAGAQKFLAQYPELDLPRGQSHTYTAQVNSSAAVLRFYRLLAHFVGGG